MSEQDLMSHSTHVTSEMSNTMNKPPTRSPLLVLLFFILPFY